MVELYINGQRVDTQKTECLFSFGVNRIGDIASRTGTFSNSFTVPATANNIRVFGFSDNPNSLSNVPYIQLDFELRSEGTYILNGVARLVKYSSAGFELQCYSNNSEWASILKGLKLSDVDFSASDHIRSQTTVITNRLNTWQDGFIYPNAEFGSLQNNFTGDNTLQWYMFYPAYFLKYIINQILTGIGYTPTGEAWNDPEFDRIVMFPSKDTVLNNGETFHIDFAAAANTNTVTVGINPTPTYTVIPYVNETNDPANQFDTTTYRFIASRPMEVSVSFELVLDPSFILVSDGTIQLTKNGVAFTSASQCVGSVTQNDRAYLTGTTTLDVGDYIDAQCFFVGSVLTVDFTSSIEITPTDTYIDGQTIYTDTSLDRSPSEFIKLWFNLFAVQFETNNSTKEINFYYSKQVYEDRNSANDVTNKIDFSAGIDIDFGLSEYGQSVILKYTYDDGDRELKKIGYDGGYFLTIGDQNLPVEVIAYEAKEAPILRVGVMNGTRELAFIPYDNNQDTIAGKIGYVILSNENRLNINGDYPANQYSVFFSDLDFETLIPRYYQLQAAIFRSQKKITALSKLQFFDCGVVDYSKPLFINGVGLIHLASIKDVSLFEDTMPVVEGYII